MKAFSESFAAQVPEKKFAQDFLLNNERKKGEKQAGTKNGTPKTKFGSHVGQSLASSTPRKEKYHMEKTEEATSKSGSHVSKFDTLVTVEFFNVGNTFNLKKKGSFNLITITELF
jgi:hypothetical protein